MKTLYGIRVPELSDFANVPADLERVAEDVNKRIAAVTGTTTTTLQKVASDLASAVARITALEDRRVRNAAGTVYPHGFRTGSQSSTTSSSGGLQITHGLGKAPLVAIVEVNDVPDGSNWIAQVKARGTTTIGVDIHDVSNNKPIANRNVRVDFICI